MAPESFKDVIEMLGGGRAFADNLGISEDQAYQWRHRNTIPLEYWSEVVEMFQDAGRDDLTIEMMAGWMSDRRGHQRRPKGGW